MVQLFATRTAKLYGSSTIASDSRIEGLERALQSKLMQDASTTHHSTLETTARMNLAFPGMLTVAIVILMLTLVSMMALTFRVAMHQKVQHETGTSACSNIAAQQKLSHSRPR